MFWLFALSFLATDPVTTEAAEPTCPNKYFRSGPAAKLPDCRAYELVTPRYTAGLGPVVVNSDGDHMFATQLISPQGDSVLFGTLGGALPGIPGTGVFDQYRSRRTETGWITERWGVYAGEAEKTSFGGASPGGEYSFEAPNGGLQASLWAPWAGLSRGAFLRGPNGMEPLARGSLGDDSTTSGLRGKFIAPGGEHVIFESEQHLEPEAPPQGTIAIYDRKPAGPTHVVSLLPDETAATVDMEYLQATPDGTEIAFTQGGCYGCNFTEEGRFPLYVRRNNAETIEVVKPNGAAIGKLLTCVGGPSSGATLVYSWLRDGQPIPGANTNEYTVVEADESHVLQCQVTATNANGTSTAVSETRVVAPYEGKTFPEVQYAYVAPFSFDDSPVEVGTLLTCNTLTGGDATVAYQWLKDGSEVPGLTGTTYTPTNADVGSSFQCRVTATNSAGVVVAYSSNAQLVVNAVPKATANPVVSNLTDPGNDPAVGDELSCSNGTWKGSPTFAYQWFRDGTAVAGETAATFVTTVADEGKSVQCGVTGTNAYGSTQALSSLVVVATAGPPTGLPKHPFVETFGSANEPFFEHPQGLAVFQSSGDLYVMDAWSRNVGRYNPDGTPDNFSDQSGNVIGNKIKFVLGEYVGPTEAQIAVDNSAGPTDGNIYITNTGDHLVDIFSPAGTFLGQLTAAGAVSFGEVCGVAVDPSGAVYVGDYNGKVHKFVPSGSGPVNGDHVASFNYANACQLASGAGPTAGFIFVNSYGGELVKMNSSTGAIQYTVATGVTTASVDPATGYVYAVLGSEFKAFDASGAVSATPVSRAKASSGQGIALRGSTGTVYSTNSNSYNVQVYGPAVQTGPEPPELITPGEISGTARVGNTLFCNSGTWDGAPEGFTRQWSRNGAEIPGATGFSYTLTAADLETVVQCRIRATNDEGSAVAVNANSGARYVTSVGPPLATAKIKFNGTAPGYTFDGIYEGNVFWVDSRTNFAFEWQDNPGNLYTMDLDTEEVLPVATTGDAQFVNISADGSHAMFTSPSQFNGEGQAGEPNLYVWSREGGSIDYVTTVRPFDIDNFGGDGAPGLTNLGVGIQSPRNAWGPASNHSRSTPDGSVFIFETTTQLTSFVNREAAPEDCHESQFGKELCSEIYRYDTRNGELLCISCGPGTGPATGEARIQTVSITLGNVLNFSTVSQGVSNDGEEVIFESFESLVPRDRNGAKDVYRWKNGAGVALISSGKDLGPSSIYSMSPGGGDIVFATHQALLPEDENGATSRLYDARVNGGFPPPESTVTEPCSNDVCQGAPSAAPEEPQLSSSSINGRGNASGKLKCGKGLRRRVRRSGKEVCAPRKRHHKRHGKSHRKHRAGDGRRAAR